MPLSQRAKIFTTFAALKGFENLIREQENTYDEMPELSDDQYEDLNFAINSIRLGDSVTVRYFRDYKIKTIESCPIRNKEIVVFPTFDTENSEIDFNVEEDIAGIYLIKK